MDIQVAQIIFQIINFGVVVGALTFLVYKPVIKTLQERSKKVQESQQAAEELIAERAESDKLKQKTLSQAKKEAAEIVAESKRLADKKKEGLAAKAKKEIQAYLQEEKDKWESEKKQLIKQIQSQMTDAVFAVAQKVLNESIDKKTHSKLIDQNIQEIVKSL